MHEQPPNDEERREPVPRIYCASLSDYNEGILHGDWVDADEDPDLMQAAIDRMLSTSPTAKRYGRPAEEWAIHDHDGFGAITIGEYTALSTIARHAAGLAEHGLAYSGWIAHLGSEPDDDSGFEDAYLGEWNRVEDYAENLLDDFGVDEILDRHITGGLRPYVTVDVEGFARDLQLAGDIVAVDNPAGGVWIYQAT